MSEESTAVEKSGAGLVQAQIDAIERRLSLDGGTTLPEIGADLANRYGKSQAGIEAVQAKMQQLDELLIGVDEKKERRQTLNKALLKARENRKAEVVKFYKVAQKYLVKEYGALEEDEKTHRPIRYGGRITIKENGHLVKSW